MVSGLLLWCDREAGHLGSVFHDACVSFGQGYSAGYSNRETAGGNWLNDT